MPHPPPRVIIVGGGLAGIAASSALSDHGFETILIERRPQLGGRATSFLDPQTGCLLDNCQHVLLGCCTNLLHLYGRLGIADKVAFFDTIHFADESGRRGDIYATRLPSPLHLALAMARFPLLTLDEKLQIAQAMAAMMLLGAEGRDTFEPVTFEAYLRDLGQSPRVIQRFWDILLTSALNEPAATASAKYGIQLFQEAFLGHRDAYRMAIPTVPLADLYRNSPATQLLINRRATSLIVRNGRVAGVTLSATDHAESESLLADYVILATAPDATRRLLEESPLRDASLIRNLQRLDFSPILGVHLWYDRPILDLPHLSLIGTQLQWLFRKDDGLHLHGVVSAADALVDRDADELVALFDHEIRQVLPTAAGAKLQRSRLIKEKRATFRPIPGSDAWRPPQATAIPGLILAGDYTRSGWPATMEGAVRSGYLAAETILRLTGHPHRILRPDL